jgi:uncharacterized membrane protein (GlpM family)
MSDRNSPVSEGMYEAAAKLVGLYEKQQNDYIASMIPQINIKLTEAFKLVGLKEWVVDGEWFEMRNTIHFTIYPKVPYYDDDYDGEFNPIIEKVANEMGIWLSITSTAYGK